MKKSRGICRWVTAAGWAALVIAQGAGAQQPSSSQSSPTLHGGVSYTDQSSQTCEEKNANNPYLGMNPFVCHGESAPTDSRGECSLNIGTVWKQVGNTCYYCSPINPPIQGMIVPLDQVRTAESQGWGCGANQTDVCTAICYGGKTFSPLSGTAVAGGGPGLPPTPAPKQGGPPEGYAPIPGPAGGLGYVPGANPCLPQGPGGYDYCQNGPGAHLPPGCVCPEINIKTTSSENAPCQPARPDMPSAAPYVRFTLGFQAGFAACVVSPTIVEDVAGAAFGSNYAVVPSLLQISATPQTMQNVIHPAGTANDSNPYLEGQTDGSKLCTWLLANNPGKTSECPGASEPLDQATQNDCLFPQCLYATECYKSGQTLQLNVDGIAQDRKTAYNCYMYAKAFVTGAFPSTLDKNYNSLDYAWLQQHGFVKQGSNKTLVRLAPAKAGDLVIVEDAASLLGMSHVGVVIGVDLSGHITRIRQKIGYNPGECVKDTTADQFENTVEPLSGDQQYQLWTNNSPGFFVGKIAR
jgi:hypothetical protein